MRRFSAWLFLLAVMASPGWARESREEPLPIPTGMEWLQSIGSRREEGLMAALLTVQSAGVEMRGSFLEFDDGLRRHLMRNPDLQAKPLTDSLADYVYETNPAARPTLDQLRRQAS